MSDTQDKPKPKTPGPFWAWLIAAFLFAQLVKRGIIGWPLPKDFNFASRFWDNLVANIVYGLPIIILFGIITLFMNLKKKE